MTKVLHMHEAMALKANRIESSEAKTDYDFWHPNPYRLREIVLSGAADFKCNFPPIKITDEDRKIVLELMGV